MIRLRTALRENVGLLAVILAIGVARGSLADH